MDGGRVIRRQSFFAGPLSRALSQKFLLRRARLSSSSRLNKLLDMLPTMLVRRLQRVQLYVEIRDVRLQPRRF